MSDSLRYAHEKLTLLERVIEKTKVRIALRKTDSQKRKARILFQALLVHAATYRDFLIRANYPLPSSGI